MVEMIIKTFFTAFILFIVLDSIFLGVIARQFYKKEIGTSMLSTPRWWSVAAVYVLLALGIVFFISQSKYNPWLAGALFGLIVYGVYDLTNYSILKDWTIKLVIVDIIWGTFATSLTSFLTKTILQ